MAIEIDTKVEALLESGKLDENSHKLIDNFLKAYRKHMRRFDRIVRQSDKMQAEIAQHNDDLEALSQQLSKYLSPQIYDMIFSGKGEAALTSSRKKLTIFFSDIVGFTSTTEKLEAEELTGLLNDYLTHMTDIALQYGGTVDKYIGDAVVIFFGDPETKGYREDALACVKMALAMQESVNVLRHRYVQDGIIDDFAIRMGINTGYTTVGNFGSNDRMDYTIIGGAVNLASRLESSAKPNQILISHETYSLVKEHINVTKEAMVEVKGFSEPIQTYQVEGLMSQTSDELHYFTEGLSLHLNGTTLKEREAAVKVLKEALKKLS